MPSRPIRRPGLYTPSEFRSIPERRVLVVDDNLIGTRPEHIARAKALFRTLADANLGKTWIAQAMINFADDEELLTLAAKAGCAGVFMLRQIQPFLSGQLKRLTGFHDP